MFTNNRLVFKGYCASTMKLVVNKPTFKLEALNRMVLDVPKNHAVASPLKFNGMAMFLIVLFHFLAFIVVSRSYQQTSNATSEQSPMMVTVMQEMRNAVSPKPKPAIKAPAKTKQMLPVTTHEKSALLANDTLEIAQSKSDPVVEKAESAVPIVPESGKKSEQKTEASTAAEPPRFDAEYLHNPSPEYPALSRRRGEQGRVLLKVSVNAKGEAEKLLLDTSSGYELLDKAAMEAVKNWKFVPAKSSHQSVAGSVIVPIRFSLEN